MHAIPLLSTWLIYKWVDRKQLSIIKSGIVWFFLSVGYYTLLLYPILIISYSWFGLNSNQSFFESYKLIFTSGTLEMTSTALASSFFLVQFKIRKKLEQTNKNLENIVLQRTKELSNVNSELKNLNESLELKVKERTERINSQLSQLIKYSHMNSHEVRAPLARILGLMQLIEIETNEEFRKDLLNKMHTSSIELDAIVKKMNRILEQDIISEY